MFFCQESIDFIKRARPKPNNPKRSKEGVGLRGHPNQHTNRKELT